jgi:hypothetical protein
MQIPFTPEEFFQLFATYNTAIWPVQLVAYGLGLISIALAIWNVPQGNRVISALLSLVWLWTGIVFLAIYYRQLNGAVAVVFGGLLALQGLLLLYAGVWKGTLRFDVDWRPSKLVGGVMIVYALLIYPILGVMTGHGYPASPLFGVAPCPTTIFTFGIFLWSESKFPRYLLWIPLLWSLIGVGAALGLGVYEDAAMPISGVVATIVLLLRERHVPTLHPPAHPTPA